MSAPGSLKNKVYYLYSVLTSAFSFRTLQDKQCDLNKVSEYIDDVQCKLILERNSFVSPRVSKEQGFSIFSAYKRIFTSLRTLQNIQCDLYNASEYIDDVQYLS